MRTALPYVQLRRELRANGYNQNDIAALLERSRPYISQRINAQTAWSISDAYQILTALDKPESELHRFFPADPYTAVERKKKPVRKIFRLVEEE